MEDGLQCMPEAIEGRSGNWPCPKDPENVWGCNMGQCLGFFFTRCAWKSSCKRWSNRRYLRCSGIHGAAEPKSAAR